MLPLVSWPQSTSPAPVDFQKLTHSTGAGQTLNIVLQPGTQRSLYQFSFTEPYLFESRNSLTLSASSIALIREDYDEERLTFKPRIGHAFDFDRDLIFTVGGRFEDVSILFADMVGFTSLSEGTDAEEVVSLLNDLFTRFDKLTEEYSVEKIRTIGDAYMVVAGAPTPRTDHAAVIVNLAIEIAENWQPFVQKIN